MEDVKFSFPRRPCMTDGDIFLKIWIIVLIPVIGGYIFFTHYQSKIKPDTIPEKVQNSPQFSPPKTINNSIFISVFNTALITVFFLWLFVILLNESNPFALFILLGLILGVKYNYKLWFDVLKKDGSNINGTIVRGQTKMAIDSFGKWYPTTWDYSLEIETDNGDLINCTSKIVALLPGDRIENAYITKRTNLLLRCDKVYTNTPDNKY